MTHDLIAAPARAARWGLAAWRAHRTAARAWRDGDGLASFVGAVRMAARGGENRWPEPGTQAQCPNPTCRGRHCAGCESSARNTARDTGHRGEHGWDEVPESLAGAMALMDPVTRARELVRQLGQRLWWPWGDVTDQRLRLRLRAHAIAARHGRRTTLRTLAPAARLP